MHNVNQVLAALIDIDRGSGGQRICLDPHAWNFPHSAIVEHVS
jgi:hypothetical protein